MAMVAMAITMMAVVQTSHLSNALFEFSCSGEMPLAPAFFREDRDDPASQQPQQRQQTDGSKSSSYNRASGSSRSSSSTTTDYYDDSEALAAAALAAAYPSAYPRVLPSGCAFEASLDDGEYEAAPNAVSLTGLSNGDHRFSVRYCTVCFVCGLAETRYSYIKPQTATVSEVIVQVTKTDIYNVFVEIIFSCCVKLTVAVTTEREREREGREPCASGIEIDFFFIVL